MFSLNLCNNNVILSFINIRKVPREISKTSGFCFQHLPRNLANVNEWKIMFDPYNVMGISLNISRDKTFHEINMMLKLNKLPREPYKYIANTIKYVLVMTNYLDFPKT